MRLIGKDAYLSQSDLIFHGMALIQPTATIPLLIAQKISGWDAVTTILIAMPTMAIAAVSYLRVPALGSSAGVSV